MSLPIIESVELQSQRLCLGSKGRRGKHTTVLAGFLVLGIGAVVRVRGRRLVAEAGAAGGAAAVFAAAGVCVCVGGRAEAGALCVVQGIGACRGLVAVAGAVGGGAAVLVA